MARDVWGIPIPDAKDVVSYISSAMNTLSIASGDKPALTPGANAVRRSGEAVSYLNSAINPFAETSKKLLGQAAGKPGANKALAKSVGTDAAVALTAALGGVGVKAVRESGLAARAYNAATGQKVLLSGRQTAGYKEIIAHGGKYSNDPETAKHAWTWFDNPQAPNYRAPKLNQIGSEALPFAHQGGTLYAVRGKSSSFVNQQLNPVNWETDTVVRSLAPQKVVGSIPIQHAGITSYQPQIQAMLKQAGFKFPKVVKK